MKTSVSQFARCGAALVLFAAAALGTGSAIADESPDNPAPAPVEPNAAQPAPINTVTYKCESGAVIVVRYDNSNPETPTAQLTYKEKIFDLFNVRAASGARYSTEQGLAPDMGLQWWTKGPEATLSEMLMDHTAPEPSQIESCTAQAG